MCLSNGSYRDSKQTHRDECHAKCQWFHEPLQEVDKHAFQWQLDCYEWQEILSTIFHHSEQPQQS